MLVYVAACAGCDSDEESTNTRPFAFLAGNYGVGVSLGFANCSGIDGADSGLPAYDGNPANLAHATQFTYDPSGPEVYFPKEIWVVTTYLGSVSIMTTPDTSTPPQPVTATVDQVDAGSDLEDAGLDLADAGTGMGAGMSESKDASPSQQTLPPSFTGLMGATLQWSASNEERSTTESGCLKRRTTLLKLQFTPDGKLFGARSVFNEYTGGADCTSNCRMGFTVQGRKTAGDEKK